MQLGHGSVVVITGAASGIGLAMAQSFAGRGCSIVLADVEAGALEIAEGTVAEAGVPTLRVGVDVSQASEVERLANATLDRFGGVDVVCNNAGVAGQADAWFGPIEGWEWVMGVNFWGVVHGVRAFLPHLVARGGGHIVNTASIAGLYPGFSPPYDASKHAVVAITEGLFATMRSSGLPIGVSCVCPGWVRTGIIDSDRNWPDRLGSLPAGDPIGDVVRRHIGRAIDEGMPPAMVADLVVDAVTAGRYWVFPHPDFLELAVERFHRIAEQVDPQPAEQVPGMPPQSQIVAEVMQALGLDDQA
jgi:NAD(P)-dependent dehydrogenase (short-subunit alcohol dehydrogenase family)